MWWCVKVVGLVLAWTNLADLTLAQVQHGVPLPSAPSQPHRDALSHSHGTSAPSPSVSAGVALPPVESGGTFGTGLPSARHPGVQSGVPLPPGPPVDHGGLPHPPPGGVALPPPGATRGHGAPLRPDAGVPLPPPTTTGGLGGVHVPAAGAPLPSPGTPGGTGAPLQPTGGVPLPPPGATRGHGAASWPSFGVPLPSPPPGAPRAPGAAAWPPVGVPLPPVVGGGGGGAGGPLPSPTLGAGVGTLKPVKNPEQDNDVQRATQLHSVMHHLQLRSKADRAVKIISIISAHKQLVTGQLLYLTLHLGETKCPIGTPDLGACAFDPSEDEHVCEVVVWDRPWLNSSKVIAEKSRCAETEDDNDFNRWGQHMLLPLPSLAEVSLHELPQGVEEQQIGVEAFNYIDHGSESKFRGEMINFDFSNIKFDPLTNTTQVQVNVEYGFTLCLKSRDQLTDTRECPPDTHRGHYICSVVVLHNPNQITSLEVIPILDDDDDIHCDRKRRNVDEELVVPVAAPCSSCPHPVPLNDPTILEVADFALKEYDRRSIDEDDLHVIVRLMKAHSQVAVGVRYFLTMEMAESLCKKTLTGADVNRTFCSQDPTEKTKICDVHVFDQPWIPARDLISARCYDRDDYPASSHDEFIVPVSFGAAGQNTASLPGAGQPLVVDEETMGVARVVVDEYNRREDDSEYYKLVQVHEASSQSHGRGRKKYTVVVELGETRCRKSDPSKGDHCPLDPTEEHEVCEAEVQSIPSLPAPRTHRVLSLRCDDLDDYLRKKLMPTLSPSHVMDHPFLDVGQDTTAGYNTLATNDSVVMSAANYVAEQFNLREDEDELYSLYQVVSALSQSFSGGVRYHLEVELAETHCKKYQLVIDISRCTVDHSEEREMCQAEVVVPHTPGGAMQLAKLYCDEMDDYYTRRIRGKLSLQNSFSQQGHDAGSSGGSWMNVSINDVDLKKLGHLIANEYDFRSDEESLFIFHKVLKARKQITSGIKYQLVVELVETVCPKYKRRINKSRCAPDIGEDHMVCEAHVMSQPWLKRKEITHLRCAEKDDFFEGDDSVEVLFPKVHPSAHARPVFQSHFLVRTSDESDESNERFYHPNGQVNSKGYDSDEDDSDEWRRVRGRRHALGQTDNVDLPDTRVRELAAFAVQSLDNDSKDPSASEVREIIQAKKQVVAGLKWTLEILVHSTTCQKNQQDLSNCPKDASKPVRHCTVTIHEQVWLNSLKVTDKSCRVRDDHV